LGPLTFGKTEELVFLGKEIATEKNYSEKMAEKIDDEVSAFIGKAYAAAEKILKLHRRALDAIAKALVEKETLEQDDFYGLLKPFRIRPSSL
jgi:cell division protease FtsH